MMRLKQIVIVFVLSLMVSNLWAQADSVYKFTLAEAQEFGIDNYFISKNAELDIDIAKKKIWETTAVGLPQLSAGVDYTYMPDIPEVAFPQTVMGANKGDNEPIVGGDFRDPDFYMLTDGESIKMGVQNNVSYNIVLSQLIFSGEYIVGLQASKVYKTFAQENYDKIRIDLSESISGTYYAIKIIEENITVLSETLRNLQLNYEHISKFYEQGLVEDTDVDQMGLVVKRTENSLNMVERQHEYLLKMFKYQIGLEATATIELTEQIEQLIDNNILGDEQYTFNLDENIDYKILTTQENLMDLSMRREKSTFLPAISGFYQYNDQFEEADFNMNIKHIFGVSATIPIASSGMRVSKVGQAKLELLKAQNMKEQEAERLILTAEQAQYDYNIALQTYKNEKDNIDLSERVFNKANIRFQEGLVSALDLSLINNQYLEAQLSYANAMQELLMAKIALDKAFNKL